MVRRAMQVSTTRVMSLETVRVMFKLAKRVVWREWVTTMRRVRRARRLKIVWEMRRLVCEGKVWPHSRRMCEVSWRV